MGGRAGENTVTIFKCLKGFWSQRRIEVVCSLGGPDQNERWKLHAVKCDLTSCWLRGMVVMWNALESNRLVLNPDPVLSVGRASCSKPVTQGHVGITKRMH